MRSFSFAFLLCNLRFGLASLTVIMLIAATATASTLWQWEYSGSGITASGTFTTVESPDKNGGYLITSITGTRNGIIITGLQAPGTSIPGNEPYTVDDLVFLGPGPQLTSGGFGFSTSDGTYANPFYARFLPTPGYLEFFSTPPFTGGTFGPGNSELPVQFSATPVPTPEPATFGLVLGALAWARVRRQLRSTLAS
ncbi:MAG: hypothetical protein JOY85_00290 [Acidobacteriaceae bacterium]|nr:hypothetical protein [Acidobacteriaceae bacterium]